MQSSMEFTKLVSILMFFICWQITTVNAYVLSEKEQTNEKLLCPSIPIYESVAYATDMTIELPCKCRPDTKTHVYWFYKKSVNSVKTQMLTPDGTQKSLHVESKIVTKMYNVIIHKARVKDSGIYICGNGDGAFFWGYDLDVQDTSNAYVAFQEHHQDPQPDLKTEHLTAFTAFWNWEKCDRCDVPGEQRKIGFCYVSSAHLEPRHMLSQSSVVPCGSHGIPDNLRKELSDRRPEIFIRSCLTPCHTRVPGLKGTTQYWLHKLSKIKNYIPFLSKAPTEKHTHTVGSSLTLACPGAKPGDAVAWDKSNKQFYKSDYLIGQKEATRIFIDHGNNLNFRYVRYSDQATYYCWLQGKLKAGIKLTLQADPTEKRKFTDSDSILALRMIGLSFAIFFLIFVIIHCLKCSAYNCKYSPSPCIADMV
ncbi:Ig-like V-type domain-containing protein FAM187A [Aquarana catesbeiana]|uniref:Ig-like V-type domain-containing protein FAM187A n=1 Tax=Aquarana catesbeiana TaxID=8400 RepID=UPI003CC9E156